LPSGSNNYFRRFPLIYLYVQFDHTISFRVVSEQKQHLDFDLHIITGGIFFQLIDDGQFSEITGK